MSGMNAAALYRLRRLREELGPAGLAALGLIAVTWLFVVLALHPAQEQNRLLESSLARHTQQTPSGQPASIGEKLAAFYTFLERNEAPTDWLAKLYGIGKATGVELQSAHYRTQQAGGRIERYEMVLPVTGSYPQLREFLKRTLTEIPVLSLDQLSLKREGRTDGAVQAELRLTLHLVKR